VSRNRQPPLAATDPRVVVVDLPLTGEWTAVRSPADRVPSHGTSLWAQAYAFDFLRFHPGTRRFHRRSHFRHVTTGVALGDCDGFGAPVSSAFPGRIVRADDTMADTDPVHLLRDLARVLRNAVRPRGWPEPWLMCGNHIVVRHRDDEDLFAFYAHLRRGSVVVAVGDDVDAGAALAQVGHTGNSTAPHLHFQLMTSADPTTAEAVPCAFRRYERRTDGTWVLEHDGVPSARAAIRSVT
jgi:murein DD-endopeptidase MepM/ murein hydrolase activator NlpD